VTGRPVRFTSAVTFEKLFLTSARPIVIAAMVPPSQQTYLDIIMTIFMDMRYSMLGNVTAAALRPKTD
jgi:hypothetical protein